MEVCDGLDNDCNELIDEDLTLEQQCGISNIGECTFSTELSYCLNGTYSKWMDCAAKLPEIEICDGKDNSCDGQTDETFNVGDICSAEVGACKSYGTFQCAPDSFNTSCNAIPNLPSPEKCDGLDNDCNGKVDENTDLQDVCGTSDFGECTYGTKYNPCVGGKLFGWVSCDAIFPKPEKCDGLDNNCDGETDEDLSQLCYTNCGIGLETCVNGMWKNCDALQPSVEICDNKDNDCDGETDEDLGKTTCGEGVCNHTIDNCVKGILK